MFFTFKSLLFLLTFVMPCHLLLSLSLSPVSPSLVITASISNPSRSQDILHRRPFFATTGVLHPLCLPHFGTVTLTLCSKLRPSTLSRWATNFSHRNLNAPRPLHPLCRPMSRTVTSHLLPLFSPPVDSIYLISASFGPLSKQMTTSVIQEPSHFRWYRRIPSTSSNPNTTSDTRVWARFCLDLANALVAKSSASRLKHFEIKPSGYLCNYVVFCGFRVATVCFLQIRGSINSILSCRFYICSRYFV